MGSLAALTRDSRAQDLGSVNHLDPGAISADLARYSRITPQTTAAWAKSILDPGARLILHVLPEDKEAEK